jgi:GAF domain-containing protein
MTISALSPRTRQARLPASIRFGAVAVIVLGAIGGYLILANFVRIGAFRPQFARATRLLPQLSGLSAEVLRMHSETQAVLDADLPNFAEVEAHRAAVAERLARLRTDAAGQAEYTAALDTVEALLITWDSQMEILRGEPSVPQVASLTFELDRSFGITEQALETLYQAEEQEFYALTSGALSTLQNTQVLLFSLGGLIGVIGLVLLIVIRRSVTSQIDRAYNRLQVAAQVGRAASSILGADELMREVVNLIRDSFGYYHASVFLLDEAGRRAVLRESTGEAGAALKARGHSLAVGSQSIIGWVTAERRPRVARDVGADPVHFKNELLPETRSELAIPLMVGDRLLGALDVQARQPNAFSETDVSVLQTLADQVAVAIANAAQYAAQHARADQLTALLEAALELAEPQPDLDSLLDHVIRRAQALVGADAAGLWLPGRGGEFELRRAYAGDMALTGGRRIEQGASLALGAEAFAGGRALRLEPGGSGLESLFVAAEFRSGLLAPVTWRGSVSAVLALSRSANRPGFDEDDQNAAQIFAAQAAAAIANFHLLAETQAELARRQQAEQVITRRNEELAALTRRERLINEITARIRGSTDVQAILAATATELGRALGAARASVEIRLEAAQPLAQGGNGYPAEGGNGQEAAA